ncbi:MAG: hypothetical protein EOP46_21645 [Sphingobacteriaceae bacterium]|nr:MAG: hypothetical protein EOP46_21645 [Sphingobacteriaceae bacterium]
MKKSKYLLMAAWLLLFCFIAGQVIVYSHQHHALQHVEMQKQAKGFPQHTVAEKCLLCDTMHHTDMVMQQNQYVQHLEPETFTYPVFAYNFKSFGLILAEGLSPPLA